MPQRSFRFHWAGQGAAMEAVASMVRRDGSKRTGVRQAPLFAADVLKDSSAHIWRTGRDTVG